VRIRFIFIALLVLFACEPSEKQKIVLHNRWEKLTKHLDSKLNNSYLYKWSDLNKEKNINQSIVLNIHLDLKSIYNPKDTKVLVDDITHLYQSYVDTLDGNIYKFIRSAKILFWVDGQSGKIYSYSAKTETLNYHSSTVPSIKRKLKIEEERKNLKVVFDVKKIFEMKEKDFEKTFGKPYTEFIATKEQKKLGVSNTVEFKKNSTSVQIDYVDEGLIFKKTNVLSVWISDKRNWLKKKDYLKLCNLQNNIDEFSIREQYAIKNEDILLGIEIKPIQKNNLTSKHSNNNSVQNQPSTPQYKNTFGLSSQQYNLIKKLESQGYLKINAQLNRVEIETALWNNMIYQNKNDFSAGLAIYVGNKKGTKLYWVEIYDLYSGKKLAKYSQSWGFKVY